MVCDGIWRKVGHEVWFNKFVNLGEEAWQFDETLVMSFLFLLCDYLINHSLTHSRYDPVQLTQ